MSFLLLLLLFFFLSFFVCSCIYVFFRWLLAVATNTWSMEAMPTTTVCRTCSDLFNWTSTTLISWLCKAASLKCWTWNHQRLVWLFLQLRFLTPHHHVTAGCKISLVFSSNYLAPSLASPISCQQLTLTRIKVIWHVPSPAQYAVSLLVWAVSGIEIFGGGHFLLHVLSLIPVSMSEKLAFLC